MHAGFLYVAKCHFPKYFSVFNIWCRGIGIWLIYRNIHKFPIFGEHFPKYGRSLGIFTVFLYLLKSMQTMAQLNCNTGIYARFQYCARSVEHLVELGECAIRRFLSRGQAGWNSFPLIRIFPHKNKNTWLAPTVHFQQLFNTAVIYLLSHTL